MQKLVHLTFEIVRIGWHILKHIKSRQASMFDKFLYKMYCETQTKGKVSTNFLIKFKRQMHRITGGVLAPCRI